MKKFDPSLYFIADSTNYTEEEFLYYNDGSYEDVNDDTKTIDIVLVDSSLEDSAPEDTFADYTEEIKAIEAEAIYVANRINSMVNPADGENLCRRHRREDARRHHLPHDPAVCGRRGDRLRGRDRRGHPGADGEAEGRGRGRRRGERGGSHVPQGA